jgi:hypothetical protein
VTSVGRYTFASWLRRGIGTRVLQPDRLGAGGSGTLERATVPVDVSLNGAGMSKSFALLGPGDVIGVNPAMVVRTEPRSWITNAEPNYLAFVEFYDEDFPWRYTPARPTGEKLSPWLALVVLEAPDGEEPGELELDQRTGRDKPLPSVKVLAADALPSLTQNWAFAHVSITEGHETPSDFEQFLLSLRTPGSADADKVISRLTCPRRLRPDTAYRAFLVPAFETGRLAGLGDVDGIPAVDSQAAAWTTGATPELPYYYDWYFRTGENEDFESLVKQLEPRPVDKRVGIRDLDATHPGFGVDTGADLGLIPDATADPTQPPVPRTVPPQAVLGLEGALRTPTAVSRPEDVDPTKPFLDDLAEALNAADDRVLAHPADDVDPLVTPPVYGGRHARKPRVDFATTGWLTTLNRDPRLRTPAGFGTRVVQTHQEDYVARAWAQVTQVLAMNRRLKLGRWAMETTLPLHRSLLAKVPPAVLLTVAKPVTRKVMGSPTTVAQVVTDSLVTSAPFDAATRRLLRSRGVVARRLRAADPEFSQETLVEAINDESVTAAPPKTMPTGLPSDEDVAAGAEAGGSTPGWLAWLKRWLWWVLLVLAVLAVVLAVVGLWPLALVAVAIGLAAYVVSRRGPRRGDLAASLRDPYLVPAALEDLPPQPGFALVELDPPARPATSGSSVTNGHAPITPAGTDSQIGTSSHAGPAGADSVEARTFRAAAAELATRLGVSLVEPKLPALDLEALRGKLVTALDPRRAWPRLLAHEVLLTFSPEWLKDPEHLVPAMAYPDFDDPMYERLRDLSSELFLPNIGLIPPETITLLRTNPAFIEAYLVGLNHELGRELLWREYPTDERGSYFRQFWSVNGLVVPPADPPLTAEQLKARYRDITPLDTWTTPPELGTHRPPERAATGDLVLTIRGELLKRYPNTLIYAQRAHPVVKNGKVDLSTRPVIRTVATEAEMRSEILFPLFTASVDPDIRFFGFDLTVASAQGAEDPKTEADDWGWYFVIQEIPGEPRFGLDVELDPDDDPTTPITWNDLSWESIPAGGFLSPAAPPVPAFMNLLSPALKAQWGRHAADMAAILFQRPVMVAVHAREMLETLDA